MRLFFLPSYRERTPSTRVRVYKPANILRQDGMTVTIVEYSLPIAEKHALLSDIGPEDVLYVQKWRTEFNDVKHIGQYKGKCKIVFDLDDRTGDEQALGLLQIADAVVVGNHYLFDLYKNTHKTFLVPSPVDLKEYRLAKKPETLSICIAKCGIRPMLKRLEKLRPVLLKVKERYDYILTLAGFQGSDDKEKVRRTFDFLQCNCIDLATYDGYLKHVVPILQKTTIGILPFSQRDNGKSGHSLLANMAMQVPTIASPFAECNHIIEEGVNGLLAHNDNEWYEKICMLLEDRRLRQNIGEAGRKTIAEKYDVPVVAHQLIAYLKEV